MMVTGAPEAVEDEIMDMVVPVAVLSTSTMAGRPMTWDEACCALRGRPESVKLARDFARETLQSWGLRGMCDDVISVISELVTNALNHGLARCGSSRQGRPIRLTLTTRSGFLLCTVTDPGAGEPVKREPDYLRECGRGLQVVESFSQQWGWRRLDGGGKVIWAVFAIPA
jgi:anti-sigma regulatory factor (Ser/Thr protein kinase)